MTTMTSRLRSWAAPIVKPHLRRVRYRVADLTDRRTPSGVDGVPLPPKQLRLLNGPRDFLKMGQSIVDEVVRSTGLVAGDDVLDVGCGSGRAAIPLINVLGPEGSYEGFDIVPEAVAWCTRRITPAHPNFRFQVADVYNNHYHRKGNQRAEHYVFPFDDERFDVVLLTSIATHLGAAPTEQYLRECARVLRPGGHLFATMFLIDDGAAALMNSGDADMTFVRSNDGSFTAIPHDPDAAVAHDEATVRAILASAGMALPKDPERGNWSGRPTTRRQDALIAVKE